MKTLIPPSSLLSCVPPRLLMWLALIVVFLSLCALSIMGDKILRLVVGLIPVALIVTIFIVIDRKTGKPALALIAMFGATAVFFFYLGGFEALFVLTWPAGDFVLWGARLLLVVLLVSVGTWLYRVYRLRRRKFPKLGSG